MSTRIGGGGLSPATAIAVPVAVSGNAASGAFATGSIVSGSVGSGAVTGRGTAGTFTVIASGTIGSLDVASGAVVTYARGVLDDLRLAGQAISGVIAVALGSGGQYVVPAERASGLRLPAVGVNVTNAASGSAVTFATQGFVPTPNSGTVASGRDGFLYVGSGGLILNQSGYMGGSSSGPGPGGLSGTLVQRIGWATSGGIYVLVDTHITSGLYSGLLGQY